MTTRLTKNVQQKLLPLSYMIGGMNIVESLPTDTVIAVCSHGDAVVGVHDLSYRFEMPDIVGDYEVFNRRLETKYTATPVDKQWGANEIDVVWLVQVPKGDYFYIAYNTGDYDRLIMVVRA